MADELKQLVQMIKNSSDTRYAKKDEATGGGVVVSYEGGGSGDTVFNLTSTTPSGMLQSDVDTLINSKLNTKIASLPANTKTVYVYTPKPFFAGLAQPPVTVNSPINSGVAWNDTVNDNYISSPVDINSKVAVSETKVFRLAKLEIAGNSYRLVLVSWDVNSNGTLSNGKYEFYADDANIVPIDIVCSPDGKTIAVAHNTNKVTTLVYNEVTSRYEKVHEFTIDKNIINMSMTGDASQLFINYNSDDPNDTGKLYLSTGGSWSEYSTVKMDFYQSTSVISKDGKKIIGTFYLPDQNRSYITTEKRSDILAHFPKVDAVRYDNIDMTGNPKISGDGKILYLSKNNTIKTCSINADDTLTLSTEAYSGSGEFANSFDVSLDGSLIAMVSTDGKGIIVYKKKADPVEDPAEDPAEATTLNANSTDPFGDSSLKHFYKLDGDMTDSVGSVNGTEKFDVTYDDGVMFGKGLAPHSCFKADINNADIKSVSLFFRTPADMLQVSLGCVWSSGRIENAVPRKGLTLGWSDTFNSYTLRYKAGNSYSNIDNYLTANTIYHLVLSDNKVYLNNKLIFSTSDITDNVSDDNGFYIGANGSYTDENLEQYGDAFKGSIDHVQVFNRVLTPEEVTKLFNTKA